MNLSMTLLITSLLILSACNGGGSSSKSIPIEQKSEAATPVVVDLNLDMDATIDGQYLAIFETLNPQLTTKITGAFTFSREKQLDELVADVRVTNAGAALIHAQNVRLGTRCPTADDDTNGDGIIDAKEGEAVYGGIYFPLDGDITSQSSHDGEFPVGDIYGNYIWARVTKFSNFIKDLRSAKSGDGYFRLQERELMDLEGRVVVIHGVDEASELPSTVASLGRRSAHQALPIACGVISKVFSPPGTIDDGIYPPTL